MNPRQNNHKLVLGTFFAAFVVIMIFTMVGDLLSIVNVKQVRQTKPNGTTAGGRLAIINKIKPQEFTVEEKGKVEEEVNDFCAKVKDDGEKSLCDLDRAPYFSDKAVKERNLSYCLMIKNASQQKSCMDAVYLQKALVEVNPDFCQGMSVEQQRTNCSNEVLYYLAGQDLAKSKQVCLKITDKVFSDKCIEKYSAK
ncbi:hypothetical protein HGA64_02440 [Candidatus Falkowbacteria bacterium]|nr:hypothetical protein [Candidatus Falkowbacteria bacterium]